MQLSIVIPVYNVEHTLSRCIESILSQGYEDYEMILVDDGSPDGSSAICDDYARRYSNIRVVHKENGGLSDARNNGIALSQGAYITFVDSDDELAPGTLSTLMDRLREHPEYDILEYPVTVNAGSPQERLLTLSDRTWEDARQYWHDTEAWEHCYAWNKVYRREIFDRAAFPVGRVFEDTWCYPEILSLNPTVATTTKGMYIYRWNGAGITATADGDKLIQLLEAEQHAAKVMRTGMLSRGGWKLYRCMLYRQLDIYALTGRVILKWPLVGLVCWLHAKLRRRGR